MLTFFLPLGDWSGDGHGHYKNYLVEAPSMEGVVRAQEAICAKYGKDFFDDMAQEYASNIITSRVIRALEENGFNFFYEEETLSWHAFDCYGAGSLERSHLEGEGEYFYVEEDSLFYLFVFLLNAFDAYITICEPIPQINNWTCFGFKSVGYGCFGLQG